jgi:hypothetical protein
LGGVSLSPGQHPAQRVVVGRWDRLLDELRLSPVAVRGDHHPASHRVGHLGSERLPEKIQRRVNTGCGASAGDH